MQIVYKKSFEKQLLDIVNYIAKDKVGASVKFANELEKSIKLISDNSFKYNKLSIIQ
jgi:plasmid stabilization system protein ParE